MRNFSNCFKALACTLHLLVRLSDVKRYKRMYPSKYNIGHLLSKVKVSIKNCPIIVNSILSLE